MGHTIDIDTGGTFTDGFFVAGERVATVKVPTTPHDLTVCFLDCIKAGAECFGTPVEDFLYQTDIIRFSNTIGTNTIIQRDGTKIGLLVTAGREGLAPTSANGAPSPLVAPDMVVAIDEGVLPSGEAVRPPDLQETLKAAQRLIDQGARCLVVCFANSEFNPANERLVRQAIKSEYPRDFLGSVPVFLSSDISRRSGEGERINAAVLNAYIHAKLVRLLYKAGEELRKRLYQRSLFIVHNNGGVARVAKTRAINTYHSGPVAGLLGAKLVGSLYGADDMISMDMGGTSFDLGYVRQGQASYTLTPEVEGLSVNVPMLAIRAIGAGGGSIASVQNGELRVGPQSAGALPGPVCFDLGGTEPTVADADLILGILDPNYFLGGTMKLSLEKARAAMQNKIAGPLGVTVEQASLLIKQAVDQAMGEEVKKLRFELGIDLDPLFVVYGGAGPAHCCDIARISGLHKLVITPFSAVFSAFSSSSMDVGHLYYRRVDLPFDQSTLSENMTDLLAAMRQEAERDMRGEGFSSDKVSYELELFVQGDKGGPELKLSAEETFFQDPSKVQELLSQAAIGLSAGQGLAPTGVVLTTFGLLAKAPVPHFEAAPAREVTYPVDQAKKGERPVFLKATEQARVVPVYDRSRLGNGHNLVGPAIVESEHTTVFLPVGWKLSVDRLNNLLMEEA
jgi:N-methylhydantoinase A/acetophenone carboxylase